MSKPARLHKQQPDEVDIMMKSIVDKLDQFMWRHATLILILAIVVLFALISTVLFLMVGFSGTESGTYYNQLEVIAQGH